MSIEEMRTTQNIQGKNIQQGIHNYEILSNPKYRTILNYSPIEFRTKTIFNRRYGTVLDSLNVNLSINSEEANQTQICNLNDLLITNQEHSTINQKYNFGDCNNFNFQIDHNDIIFRALNLG